MQCPLTKQAICKLKRLDCTHTYEKTAIDAWQKINKTGLFGCPLCWVNLSVKKFITFEVILSNPECCLREESNYIVC